VLVVVFTGGVELAKYNSSATVDGRGSVATFDTSVALKRHWSSLETVKREAKKLDFVSKIAGFGEMRLVVTPDIWASSFPNRMYATASSAVCAVAKLVVAKAKQAAVKSRFITFPASH